MQILIFIKASVKYNQSTLDCNTIGPLDDLYLYVKVIIKSKARCISVWNGCFLFKVVVKFIVGCAVNPLNLMLVGQKETIFLSCCVIYVQHTSNYHLILMWWANEANNLASFLLDGLFLSIFHGNPWYFMLIIHKLCPNGHNLCEILQILVEQHPWNAISNCISWAPIDKKYPKMGYFMLKSSIFGQNMLKIKRFWANWGYFCRASIMNFKNKIH